MALVITGFMATGKSTVAVAVAKMLKLELIDTDQEIERQTQKRIADIFKYDGEPAFRGLEAQLCAALATRENLVIATGGGTLIDEKCRALFLKTSMVFCLHLDETTLEKRLEKSDRPLAKDWRALLKMRAPIYEGLPNAIDAGRPPDEIAQEIVKRWRSRRVTTRS